jgi:enediyne polyketide synthase
MEARGNQDGAVAIIGMACRFPGAQDPAEFHELLVAGRRMFQPVDALPGRPLYAALLDDWIPPVLFGDPGLGPHDLGPVQKLAAEMTALALTDAGLLDVAGSARIGLLIASVTPSLCDLVRSEFGFSSSGPYPQAAYSSSLHAVTAAADALQAGDLDLAVAGGVELGIDPVWLALQARAGTLATGKMRVYAADPAGLLPGEGCAMVVLARSADARAAGVPVYAEIAGWSTPRVGAPAGAAETSREAYRQAGIDPADIQLVEGQGTGTAAGDTAELAALTDLRRGGTAVAALGAASASIGYAKAAAGIASLVKTALAMAAGTIPPGTGPARPHPLIESGEALLRMPAYPEAWPPGPRLAAVNSLGAADPAVMPGLPGFKDAEGVHLVLRREAEADRWAGRRRRRTAEDPPATPDAPDDAAGPEPPASGKHTTSGRPVQASGAEPPGTAAGAPSVFAFCGEEPAALADQLEVIAASVGALSAAKLDELARQLALGALRAEQDAAPGPQPLRVALTAATPGRLAAQAQYAARRLRADGAVTVTEPEVHISAGASGRVVVLFPGRPDSTAHSVQLAISLESLRTLDLLGIKPAVGVGYGLAEITALVWAGCLPAAEAARLVAQRGQVLRACSCGPSAMARVTADADLTRALCEPDRLHIAAYEGPRTHVLAGSTMGIRELARRAATLGVPADVLGGTIAMHSPAMARCVAPLRGVFSATGATAPQRRVISTITGQLITADDDIADLLARQVAMPVLFVQAITQAAQEADLIVVAGPDAGMAAAAAGCAGIPAVAIPADASHGSTGTGEAGAVFPARTVAALFAAGAISDLLPFLATARPADALASRTVPRMRDAEPAGPGQAAPHHESHEPAGSTRMPWIREVRSVRKLTGEDSRRLPVRSERHARRPVGGEPDAQHLVQFDVVPVEPEARACHVQPPDPGGGLADLSDGLIPVRVQVVTPSGQGLGVVLPQVLLVPHLEAGVVHERDQVAGALELAVREHVPVDEPGLADGGLDVVRPGDAVVEQPPADV